MKKLIFVCFFFHLISCRHEPTISQKKIDNFNNGFFVLCEGTFGSGNASVSFFDKTKNEIFNDIFRTVNKFPLGDQAQSIFSINNNIYIVVQNSQKIEVVDAFDFKLKSTIQSSFLNSPRYCISSGSEIAYVSDWESDGVIKIDLNTNQSIKNITTGQDPEQMYLFDNKLFICNSGYSGLNTTDSTVAIMNLETELIVKKIVVGKRPTSIVQDANGMLWINCKGIKKYDINGDIDPNNSSAGSFWKINPINYQSDLIYELPNKEYTPSNMAVSNDKKWLYYSSGGKIWAVNLSQNSFMPQELISKNTYSLAIDPENGNLIVCVEQGFTSQGKIERYAITNGTNLSKIDEYTTGVLPNAILFRELK